MSQKTNEVYIDLLSRILRSQNCPVCRGHHTREQLVSVTTIDMSEPVVTLASRKLGYRFMCAEAAWILSGDNCVAPMKPFSRIIEQFSDDGVFFSGAYGPKVVDQLPYILRCLTDDRGSRQAVMTIWRERPGPSKDIPCTVAVQFLIRDGLLHLVDTMRSSDAWLGVPYDWFTFSMLGAYVCLLLRDRGVTVYPGTLTMVAGSQHLYDGGFGYTLADVAAALEYDELRFNYAPLDLSGFNKPKDLIDCLWCKARDGEMASSNKWLAELRRHDARK